MTVCRAGVAASEVSLCTYVSKLKDRSVMPVPSFNVISGVSRAGNCLACQDFMIVLTGAGSSAEAMTTDSEVHHTLEFGRQEDVWRNSCSICDTRGFAPSVQDNNEVLNLLTEGRLLQNSGHSRRTRNVPPSRRREALD